MQFILSKLGMFILLCHFIYNFIWEEVFTEISKILVGYKSEK